jgi:hypothetical protein
MKRQLYLIGGGLPPSKGRTPPYAEGTMRRKIPWFLAFLLALPAASLAAEIRVDLKNDSSMAVSVPLGTDNGVTKESDFAVLTPVGVTVYLYPFELYRNMFWSQPLSADSFSRVAEGNPVRSVTLEKEDHLALREAGAARKAELLAKQEEARREAARRETDTLRKRKEHLEAHRNELSARISAAEKAFLEEEARYNAAAIAFEAGVEQSLQSVLDCAGQREDLLERRAALSGRRPATSAEIDRLTARIRQLEGQIASERENIRLARDARRAARAPFVARRQDWQRLLAERNQVSGEIRAVEGKIREPETRR